MEDFVRVVVSELLLKYGPGVLPWLCLLVGFGTFYLVVSRLLTRLFLQNDMLFALLREGVSADKDMAVEYRRLTDVVTMGGLAAGKKR